MSSIAVREILNLPQEALWKLDTQYPDDVKFLVAFDDVDYPCTARYLIVSSYLWQLHRWYPKTPILSNHYLGSRPFDTKSIPTILTRIVDEITKTYNLTTDEVDTLGIQVTQVNNQVYNMAVNHLGGFVQTIDARAYLEVLHHPQVVAMRQVVKENPTTKNMQDLYRELPALATSGQFLPENSLVGVIRLKSVPQGQINQCVGARGLISDIDGTVFPHMVTDSFGTGLNDIADFMIESRSAAKALFYQKSVIKNTEYFNRRLQLQNQTISTIIDGDCGSTWSLPWHVQPGDLKDLEGRYYYEEDNRQLQCIDSKKSGKIIGKTIRLRSPVMCLLSKTGHVCETCFGRLAKTLARGTNVGHLSAYLIGEKISQWTLSTKHLDQILEIAAILLDKQDLKYIRLSQDRNELIKFVKSLQGKKVSILLPVEDVTNLTQAMAAENLSDLSIFKISQLTRIAIKMQIEEGDPDTALSMIQWVTVSGPSRPSSLSVTMLKYIKKHGYRQTDPRYIEVDLSEWNYEHPAFKLPQKQMNTEDFMKQVSNMIESDPNKGIKKNLDPTKPEDLVSYLRQIYEFASQHIQVPLVYYEIITLAVLVKSIKDNDYRFTDDFNHREFASSSAITFNRSIGAALAYEQQTKLIYRSDSYQLSHRVAHPMDKLFKPDLTDSFYQDWAYTPPEPHVI